jgi:GNAT superfamily N-acetyltransferase
MNIRELVADEEIQGAFTLMAELRARVRPDTFLAEVRRQQVEGYRLFGLFDDEGALVALAGARRTHTLSRGEHLFVDDLVTADRVRGRGFGTALLTWLAARAAEQGLSCMYLDSRNTAKSFYEQIGFEMLTSIPCRIDVAALLPKGPTRPEEDS